MLQTVKLDWFTGSHVAHNIVCRNEIRQELIIKTLTAVTERAVWWYENSHRCDVFAFAVDA